MATSSVDAATANQGTLPVEVPSQAWCIWQGLKGTNPQHLTIPDVDLRTKWILLTGGNSGIGFEAALQFVRWGANIVLGCRQPPPHEMHPYEAVQALKAAAIEVGHQETVIEFWECDMSRLESVEAFAKRWLDTGRPLHVLVNNAGINGVGELKLTQDGFEIVHQVCKPLLVKVT